MRQRLTLDDSGIPSKAEDRLKIAEKIVRRAEEYGIDRSDIIIDCLVLTASAQQSEVVETIRAVELVKATLGVKTTLGVSNVSFGLPQRELLNRTFLAAALTAGLDAPILNPLSKDMTSTVDAFNVLWNIDKNSKKYINSYSAFEGNPTFKEYVKNSDLNKVIIDGLKEEVREGNIKLVGLSALMTTTVRSMEETIKALRENNLDCTVFVGGAVLNEEYAEMIGADFYAKDATQSVKIAREFFHCD